MNVQLTPDDQKFLEALEEAVREGVALAATNDMRSPEDLEWGLNRMTADIFLRSRLQTCPEYWFSPADLLNCYHPRQPKISFTAGFHTSRFSTLEFILYRGDFDLDRSLHLAAVHAPGEAGRAAAGMLALPLYERILAVYRSHEFRRPPLEGLGNAQGPLIQLLRDNEYMLRGSNHPAEQLLQHLVLIPLAMHVPPAVLGPRPAYEQDPTGLPPAVWTSPWYPTNHALSDPTLFRLAMLVESGLGRSDEYPRVSLAPIAEALVDGKIEFIPTLWEGASERDVRQVRIELAEVCRVVSGSPADRSTLPSTIGAACVLMYVLPNTGELGSTFRALVQQILNSEDEFSVILAWKLLQTSLDELLIDCVYKALAAGFEPVLLRQLVERLVQVGRRGYTDEFRKSAGAADLDSADPEEVLARALSRAQHDEVVTASASLQQQLLKLSGEPTRDTVQKLEQTVHQLENALEGLDAEGTEPEATSLLSRARHAVSLFREDESGSRAEVVATYEGEIHQLNRRVQELSNRVALYQAVAEDPHAVAIAGIKLLELELRRIFLHYHERHETDELELRRIQSRQKSPHLKSLPLEESLTIGELKVLLKTPLEERLHAGDWRKLDGTKAWRDSVCHFHSTVTTDRAQEIYRDTLWLTRVLKQAFPAGE